jgi:hypothetical protein
MTNIQITVLVIVAHLMDQKKKTKKEIDNQQRLI